MLSSTAYVQIDATFFAERLRRALAYRERLFAEPFYRLVHGEAYHFLMNLSNVVRQSRKGCHLDIQTVKTRLRQLKNYLFHEISAMFQGISNILGEIMTILAQLATC